METRLDRARARYVVEVWADVSILDQTVDRVVVGMAGFAAPVDVHTVDGLGLSEAERAAVLDALSSDTWPSWDYE
ncbi:MAG: hypothetical protein ACT4PW_02025 [Acidimicrobiia bacterium]